MVSDKRRSGDRPTTGAHDPLAELRRALEQGHLTQVEHGLSPGRLPGRLANALGAGAALVYGDVNGTLSLGVIIEQARQPGASVETLRRAYLARLLAHTNQLPLLAGKPGSKQVQL